MKKLLFLISVFALTLLLTSFPNKEAGPPVQQEQTIKIVQPELAIHFATQQDVIQINQLAGFELAREGDIVLKTIDGYSTEQEAEIQPLPFTLLKPDKLHNIYIVDPKCSLADGFKSKIRPPLKQSRS